MAEFAAVSAKFEPARTSAQRRFLEMGYRIRGRVRARAGSLLCSVDGPD